MFLPGYGIGQLLNLSYSNYTCIYRRTSHNKFFTTVMAVFVEAITQILVYGIFKLSLWSLETRKIPDPRYW